MTAKLAREAVEWGDTTLIANRTRLRPGGEQLEKEERLAKCLDAWHAASRRVLAASLVGHAFENGIQDPCYRKKLVSVYVEAMDERPELVS